MASERIARDFRELTKERFARRSGYKGFGKAGGSFKSTRVSTADQRLIVYRDIGCKSAAARQHARWRRSGP